MFENAENINRPYKSEIEFDSKQIETEINYDIEYLNSIKVSKLYKNDYYKIDKKHHVEILSPISTYQGHKHLIKNSDNVRFLLSLYPDKDDLRNLKKIILRPRHIEAGNIELISLYLRKSQTLVLYLHYPHDYDAKNGKFSKYNEMMPFDLTYKINKHFYNKFENQNDYLIPPLLYILSMLPYSTDNEIDKFFIRINPEPGDQTLKCLDDISYFFYNQGY